MDWQRHIIFHATVSALENWQGIANIVLRYPVLLSSRKPLIVLLSSIRLFVWRPLSRVRSNVLFSQSIGVGTWSWQSSKKQPNTMYLYDLFLVFVNSPLFLFCGFYLFSIPSASHHFSCRLPFLAVWASGSPIFYARYSARNMLPLRFEGCPLLRGTFRIILIALLYAPTN